MEFETFLDELVEQLKERKRLVSSSDKETGNVMYVSIEGLSNSGKSTLAMYLEQRLGITGYNCIYIEGDKFQRSKGESMQVYHHLIEKAEREGLTEKDYLTFPGSVWNFAKLEREVFGHPEGEILLRDILEKKQEGTKHDERYAVDGSSIVLVPGMYLRHLSGFDFNIKLDVSVDVCVERKIRRDREQGGNRDPVVTRKMVDVIELPAMNLFDQNYPINGLVANTNDFNDMSYR